MFPDIDPKDVIDPDLGGVPVERGTQGGPGEPFLPITPPSALPKKKNIQGRYEPEADDFITIKAGGTIRVCKGWFTHRQEDMHDYVDVHLSTDLKVHPLEDVVISEHYTGIGTGMKD